MKKLELTNVAPIWFTWEIIFHHQGEDFWSVKIKTPLDKNVSLYVFLFKIMEDLFKDQPELKIHKFWEIFSTSMEVNGKEITEKQIMELFGDKFTIKFKKLWIK